MTVNAAIWCLAVCVCNTINKAGMYGTGAYQIRSQPFCSWTAKNELTRLHPEKLEFKAKKEKEKVLLLHKYWQNHHINPANGNVFTFSLFSDQLQAKKLSRMYVPTDGMLYSLWFVARGQGAWISNLMLSIRIFAFNWICNIRARSREIRQIGER